MNTFGRVGQLLDEEHRATLDLQSRLESALARRDDEALAVLAPALVRSLEQEIGRHFTFEENELFPRLAAAGDGDVAALLADEHDTLRAVAAELLPLARRAERSTADATALRHLAAEWGERLVAHVQKETMALLPLLPDLLDDTTDAELALAYATT